MEVTLQLGFKTTLTAAEFRLVTLALAGKLNKRDLEFAQELNHKLLEARKNMLSMALKTSEGALKSAEGDS